MNRTSVTLWSVFFVVVGLAIFAHKHIQLNFPLLPDQQAEAWTVQARLSFVSTRRNVKATLQIPNITPGYSKLDEYYISGDFGLQSQIKGDNKSADWAIRKAKGEHVLYYLTNITHSQVPSTWPSVPDYPPAPAFPEPQSVAINKIIQDVRSQSADTASFTYELIKQLNQENGNENVSLLKKFVKRNELEVDMLMQLLSVAHIPARKIWLLELVEKSDVAPVAFVQVYNGDEWLTYDPVTGASGLPDDHIVWSVGNEPLFKLQNAGSGELTFSVKSSNIELLSVARNSVQQTGSMLGKFTLYTLPLQIQHTYSLLLMVPLGALLVVFMRTVVGVQTFGTFMPILIAVAFRETQLGLGILLFSVIVFIGLLIRFYLERLRLLLIPRLAVILVVVVILMLFISLATSASGIERLLSVSLFPIVILAMTIERMSITWEENGANAAMLQGLGSLFVASLGYLVMTNSYLTYLMFVYPEFLFVVLGLSMLMGRYTGYRLNELMRFRSMVKIDNAQK